MVANAVAQLEEEKEEETPNVHPNSRDGNMLMVKVSLVTTKGKRY